MNGDTTEERSYEMPADIDIEQAVLGCILLAPAQIAAVRKWLAPEHFYRPIHGQIYRAMCDVADAGTPPDFLLVGQHLKSRQLLAAVGGHGFLSGLATACAFPSHAEFYARKVLDLHVKRQAIKRLHDAPFELAECSSPAEALITLTSSLDEIKRTATPDQQTSTQIGEIATMYYNQLEEISQRGIDCGFTAIQRIVNGWQPGTLNLIGARPSMGKTSLALNLMEKLATLPTNPRPYSSVLFSLEMPKELIMERFYCQMTNLTTAQIRNAANDSHALQKLVTAVETFQSWPVLVYDMTDRISTPEEISAHCRDLKAQGKLPDFILIDHMQRLKSKQRTQNRNMELELISGQLKNLAIELNRPVTVLSQLGREVEKRANKRPTCADLRDCGALEQDADVIAFIYRDERYNPESIDRGTAEIIIAKNRSGELGTAYLRFDAAHNRFYDTEADFRPHNPDSEYPVNESRKKKRADSVAAGFGGQD